MIFVIRSPEQTLSESIFDLEPKNYRETVIPTMDSDENNILLGLKFSNDLRFPVRNGGHQVVLELQLLSQRCAPKSHQNKIYNRKMHKLIYITIVWNAKPG